MDLNSRWDHYAVLSLLLLAIAAMAGCQGLSNSASSGSGSTGKNGSVSAANSSLDFGMVVVGSSKTISDTITNGSSVSVTIASAKATNAQYEISGPAFPLVLAPGQSASLTITFKPGTAGKPSGTVVISMMNSSSNTELDIAVAGSAVAAGTLTASSASLPFGSIQVGQSQAQSASLTNSGGSNVTISQASSSNGAFTISGLILPLMLAPGQNTTFTVTFAPKAAGAVNATVSFNGSASLTMGGGVSNQQSSPTSVVVRVSGNGTTAGQLALSPANLSFGNVPVHTTQNLAATLTNSGGTSATITQAIASGSGFALSGLALPVTLGPGKSVSFQVTFTPTSSGAVLGSVTIGSTASNSSLSMALTGAGVNPPGSLMASPASFGFGSVVVGRSQSQSGILANSGSTRITILKASTTGVGFSVSGITLPLTLSPGQSTAFTATFAPTTSGNITGDIVFSSSITSLNVPLTGSGLTAGLLGASPAIINFGNVQVGSNQTQTITLTNGSSSSVIVSQASASGIGFRVTGLSLPLTLAAGQSMSFTAMFTPSSAGSVAGNLTIMSNAANMQLNVALSGTGVTAGVLAATLSSINFGSVQVGRSLTRSETLTNSGGSSINLSAATVRGVGFRTSGLNVPTTLNTGQSLTFDVIFTPQAAGSANGTITLAASGSVPALNVSLLGTATAQGQLTVAPTTFSFGNVTVGATRNLTGSLTASGASVTVSSVTLSNPEFTLSALSLPLTLAAGQSASFSLIFTPMANGASSATITFTSNATNPSVVESSTGNGTPATQHIVTLTWNPEPSTIAGYNVYRGTQSGGPYVRLNGAMDPSASYVDSSVQSGQTYYYVVTAVSDSGSESAHSNQVQAVIPTP